MSKEKRLHPGISRRDFVKRSGLLALAATGTGVLSSCGALSERHGSAGSADVRRPDKPTYRRTLHAVQDLGWDPTGRSLIDESLAAAVTNGTRITVPPGRYLVSRGVELDQLEHFGIIGTGKDRVEVVFQSPDGTAGFYLLEVQDGSHVELGNFTVDWTMRRDTAGPGFRMRLRDSFHAHDVEWVGYTPPSDIGDAINCYTDIPAGSKRNLDIYKMFIHLTEPTGFGLIERLVVAGPSHIDGHKGGQGVGGHFRGFEGTMHYLDCHFENVNGDSTIYTSGFGKVIFENCFVKNSAMACLRLGGDSEVRNCTVVQDHADGHPQNTGQYCAANGFLWASQVNEESGGLIENTDIFMRNMTTGGNAIRVHTSSGGLTIRNVNIYQDSDFESIISWDPEGIVSDSYGDYTSKKPWFIHLENVKIVGSGKRDSVIRLDGRDGSVLRNVCIDSPNAERGVWVRGCEDVEIRDCTINVGGEAVVNEGSTFRSLEFVSEESCRIDGDAPIPSTSH